MNELKNPNPDSLDDINNLQAFKAEVTMRYAIPLNVMFFSILVASFLVAFKFSRLDNILKVIKVFSLIIFLQVLTIVSSNISIKFENMHYVNFIPSLLSFLLAFYIILNSKKLTNVKK